jgi:Protein of unknown function (DUF3800)
MTPALDPRGGADTTSWSMAVADLAQALCLDRGLGVLVMLAAYFDESYSDTPPRTLAVAGYLSSAEQWSRFEGEWQEFLQRYQIQNPFHMTDFMAGRGQFRGWSRQKHDRCIESYCSIINRRTNLRISIGFDLSVYEDEMRRFSDIGPYGFCVFEWMQEAERFMDRNDIRGPIAYVFEDGSGFGNQIFNTMVWIKRRKVMRERYRLGSFSFADKRAVLPLQAADILAWESRSHHARLLQTPPLPMRPSLRRLASRGKHQGIYFSRVGFAEWKRRLLEYAAVHPDPEEGL